MNIYQHENTGRICDGYCEPSARYIKIGAHCEKCGKINQYWRESNYCVACRAEFQSHAAANYETRPIGT